MGSTLRMSTNPITDKIRTSHGSNKYHRCYKLYTSVIWKKVPVYTDEKWYIWVYISWKFDRSYFCLYTRNGTIALSVNGLSSRGADRKREKGTFISGNRAVRLLTSRNGSRPGRKLKNTITELAGREPILLPGQISLAGTLLPSSFQTFRNVKIIGIYVPYNRDYQHCYCL